MLLKKINKKIKIIIFTVLTVISIIVIPTIVMGVKFNQKSHPVRVPFRLLTPLPESWYTLGDIYIISDELFKKQLYVYKENIKKEDLPISYAKLNSKNLNTIKDYYNTPLLDLSFDLDYNEIPDKINVNLPNQIEELLNKADKEDINSYNSQARTQIDQLGPNTIGGFAYQVINLIYKNIQKIREEAQNSKDKTKEVINSYLYTLDKDIDVNNPNPEHRYYRLQVWPSTLSNLSIHSDGSSYETIGKKIEHVYNYAPITTPVMNKGYSIASGNRNLFNSGRRREKFCYSEKEHSYKDAKTLPPEISSNTLSEAEKELLYKKILKYLCTPLLNDKLLTLYKENLKYDVVWTSADNELIWPVNDTLFNQVSIVAQDLNDRGIAWFTLEPTVTDQLRLKIKKDIVDEYAYTHLNLLTCDKDEKGKIDDLTTCDDEWQFTWSQAVGSSDKLIGWWVAYDLINTGRIKSFVGQYFEGYHDNDNKKDPIVINCDPSNPPLWTCKQDPTFKLNWGVDHPINHKYFVLETDASLSRRYKTFSGGNNADHIIEQLKDLLKIGHDFITNSLFRTLASIANEKLGKEFLDILRSVGALFDNDEGKNYWNLAIEELRLYLQNDSGINWYSLFTTDKFSDKDLADAGYDTTDKINEYIKGIPFIAYFNFLSSEKGRIGEYLMSSILGYSGFSMNINELHNFKDVTSETPVSINPNSNSELKWYAYLDDKFNVSSVNAGLISFMAKYILLISHNNKILEGKNFTVSEKIDNLQQMLWNTYKIPGSTQTLKGYYHVRGGIKQTGPLTIEEISTEFSIEPFRLWLENLFGKEVQNY